MQQYSGPAPSGYSAPSGGHQQPLFIIIPSSGKGYKQPSIYPAASYASRGSSDHYESYGAESSPVPVGPHRRLSPYFRRRSASLLKRKRAPATVSSSSRPPPSPALAHVLQSSLDMTSPSPPSMTADHSPESGRKFGAGLRLTKPSGLLPLGSTKSFLSLGLSSKTSDMANRIRNRRRQLWPLRSRNTSTTKPLVRHSRAGSEPGELEDGSSRFIEADEEMDSWPEARAAGRTIADRQSTPVVKSREPATTNSQMASRWRETTTTTSTTTTTTTTTTAAPSSATGGHHRRQQLHQHHLEAPRNSTTPAGAAEPTTRVIKSESIKHERGPNREQ